MGRDTLAAPLFSRPSAMPSRELTNRPRKPSATLMTKWPIPSPMRMTPLAKRTRMWPTQCLKLPPVYIASLSETVSGAAETVGGRRVRRLRHDSRLHGYVVSSDKEIN